MLFYIFSDGGYFGCLHYESERAQCHCAGSSLQPGQHLGQRFPVSGADIDRERDESGVYNLWWIGEESRDERPQGANDELREIGKRADEGVE